MTIAAAMGLQGTFTPDTAAPAVIQFVRQLSAGVGIPANLAQLNKVDPADFAALAELALHDTCMSTNQITPTRDEVVAVYTAAFRGSTLRPPPFSPYPNKAAALPLQGNAAALCCKKG